MKQFFLVEIDIIQAPSLGMEDSIEKLNYWLAEGRIQTFGVSDDHKKLWLTLIADSEYDAWETIGILPFDGYFEPVLTSLSTYNQSIDLQFPAICLN
ncbi:MAG: hypothetical protein KTR24_15545 [Saprospiraceae bacterium]|nr:hypothetical protein [Saprospiraceae bacterium]